MQTTEQILKTNYLILFFILIAAPVFAKQATDPSAKQRKPAEEETFDIGCQTEGRNCVDVPYLTTRTLNGYTAQIAGCSKKSNVVVGLALNFCAPPARQ